MRGHIEKRSKDSYSIKISVGKDDTGKYKYQWVTVKGTKKDAEKRLSEIIHQLDNGVFIRPSNTTLADYLSRWLKDYAWANLAPRTCEGYEHIIGKHILPQLGRIALTELKPSDVQGYYADKLTSGRRDGTGGLSPRTVRHHHVTLHDALQTAVKWGLIMRNPCDAVTPPAFQRREMKTMDVKDVQRFLEAVKNTPHYALFFTLLYTGLRRSEALALRWLDVDLILCQLSVSRTLHHLQDGRTIFRQPKTARSRRMIALPPSLALELTEHRRNQETICQLCGIALTEDRLLFCQPDGTPLLPDTITHVWIDTVNRLGLKGIRLHDARHTHASLMLKQGANIKVISERLGHASIATTMDVYGHVMPGMQKEAALRFDEMMNADKH